MESREVFSQPELEAVLGNPDLIPICAGDGEFTVGGNHFVRAADSARLVVGDSVAVEAGGATTVVATGRAHVTARDAAGVEAADSVRVIARNSVFVRARGRSRIVAGADSTVEAGEDSFTVAMGRAGVRAEDRCRVRALLNARVILRGEARVWAWGRAVVQATDAVSVTAWGSAHVVATGSAAVEALEMATVAAGGSATVHAFGAAVVRARNRARVDAAPGVAVMRHAPATVSGGGAAEATHPTSAGEWCAYYGVPVDDGVVVLYKAVDQSFQSYHGTSYVPGSSPMAADWDGGEQECGGGLHFSPRPTFALAAPAEEARFVACPVLLADLAFHPGGLYQSKVKARGVCAPVYEVDEDGAALPSPA
jgi:hypothetical protein